MYTDLTAAAMAAAMDANERRLRNSTKPHGGRPYRCATGMAVPKVGKLKGRSSVGPVYNAEEERAVSFQMVKDVSNYCNNNVFVRVGSELRKYVRGAPMGEPGSCSSANGVCIHGEQTWLAQRELQYGDSARVDTIGFVDDIQFRFAYDVQGRVWPKSEALEMCKQVHNVYPPPLSLE